MGEKVRAEPFDAIGLDLAMLWNDIPTPPGRVAEAVATYVIEPGREHQL